MMIMITEWSLATIGESFVSSEIGLLQTQSFSSSSGTKSRSVARKQCDAAAVLLGLKTDGRTDRQTDGRLTIAIPRFALHASHDKNMIFIIVAL